MIGFPWPATVPAPPAPTAAQRAAHRRGKEHDFDRSGIPTAVRRRCSCSWFGPDRLSEETVMRDHASHLQAVAAGRDAA